MDIRIGGASLPSSQIALTSPDPDANPAGSQTGSWSFDTSSSRENPSREQIFGAIADGGRDARPTDSDTYLTAMYEQYVNYRGPKRGTVENPLTPGKVHTVVMARTEGALLDLRV